jgi:tetratricopeptide (TPR) repeat protein
MKKSFISNVTKKLLLRITALAIVTLLAFSQPAESNPGTPAETEPNFEQMLRAARVQKGQLASRAIPPTQLVLSLARQTGKAEYEVEALILLSECAELLQNQKDAEDYCRQALELARAKGMAGQEAKSLVRQGALNMAANRYERGVESFLEAARIAESLGDRVLSAVIEDRLGIANYVLKDRDRALAQCRAARAVLEKSGDPKLIADNLEHLAIIYTGDKDWAEAYECLQQALELRESLGDRYALVGTLADMGYTLDGLKRAQEAIAVLERALALSTELQITRASPSLHTRIGRAKQSLGQNEAALRHYQEALKLDRLLGGKRRLAADLLVLSQFHRSVLKDYARALEYLEEYNAVSRELYSEETTSRIVELQERFDAARKEREIERLKQDRAIQELNIKKEALTRNAAIVAAVFLVVFLGLAFYRYRVEARISRELREALNKIKTLHGLLPICSNCKNIRDDAGYWHQVESYVAQHSQAEFTHGICPSCIRKLYPQLADSVLGRELGNTGSPKSDTE